LTGKRQQIDLKRKRILKAARKVFAQKGYRETDVQEIADIARVGKGTVYRYFGDKKGLFLATVDEGVGELQETVLSAIFSTEDTKKRLESAARASLQFFDKNKDLLEIFIQERSEFRGREKSTYFKRRDEKIEILRDILRKGVKEGTFRKLNVRITAELMTDLIFGTVVADVMRGRGRRLAARAKYLVDFVWHGILKE